MSDRDLGVAFAKILALEARTEEDAGRLASLERRIEVASLLLDATRQAGAVLDRLAALEAKVEHHSTLLGVVTDAIIPDDCKPPEAQAQGGEVSITGPGPWGKEQTITYRQAKGGEQPAGVPFSRGVKCGGEGCERLAYGTTVMGVPVCSVHLSAPATPPEGETEPDPIHWTSTEGGSCCGSSYGEDTGERERVTCADCRLQMSAPQAAKCGGTKLVPFDDGHVACPGCPDCKPAPQASEEAKARVVADAVNSPRGQATIFASKLIEAWFDGGECNYDPVVDLVMQDRARIAAEARAEALKALLAAVEKMPLRINGTVHIADVYAVVRLTISPRVASEEGGKEDKT